MVKPRAIGLEASSGDLAGATIVKVVKAQHVDLGWE